MTTKTDQLFQLTAPYDNPFQGKDPRLLFVCSAGLLRSATGANLFAKKGFNTRNCGTHRFALIPLSTNLIMWADHIIFVHPTNYDVARETYNGNPIYYVMDDKAMILNIPDDYDYNHPKLLEAFEEQLKGYIWTRKDTFLWEYEDKPGDPKSTS